MKLKGLIVEDDAAARMALEKICSKISDLEIIGVCENGVEALEFIQQEDLDMVLLDIEMPELNGIELLKSISPAPPIVFTTSNPNFAVEAFEFSATDYLIKPIELPRLLQAYEKVKKQLGLLDPPNKESADGKSIFIKVDSKLVKIQYDELQYVEAKGDYAVFRTMDQSYIVHATLTRIASRLPQDSFLKVHRSFIVNLQKIKDIEDFTILIDGKVIPVSRGNRETLMKRINLL